MHITKSLSALNKPAVFLSLLFVLNSGLMPPRAVAADFTEDQVKAVFIFNFANFVEWPAHLSSSETFRFCSTAPENDVSRALRDSVIGESIRDNSAEYLLIDSVDKLPQCHILYIPQSRTGPELVGILSAAHESNVLTVGDSSNFAKLGGAIGLAIEDGRVRVIINRTSLRIAGLQASSKLLRIATRIDGKSL